MMPSAASEIVILDTNALLDWRVFKDPAAQPLVQGLASGRFRWLASPAMLTEWNHVWPRSVFQRWQPDPALTTTVYEHAHMVDEPPRGPLRCTDPDDQVFIDLALHVGAQWLFTKDAALLKLAKRARQRGVTVISLQRWCAQADATAANLNLATALASASD
jgi:predicted nucleic acid-binding protein